jgi:hypothetical protein
LAAVVSDHFLCPSKAWTSWIGNRARYAVQMQQLERERTCATRHIQYTTTGLQCVDSERVDQKAPKDRSGSMSHPRAPGARTLMAWNDPVHTGSALLSFTPWV